MSLFAGVSPGAPGAQVTGDDIVRSAEKYLGRPYCYGGVGPGCFDCSGLVWRAMGDVGISVPRTGIIASDMAGGQPIGVDGDFTSTLGLLAPGDVIYWGTAGPNGHEGIYAGGDQMINAPFGGTVVRFDKIDAITSSRESFAGVRRWANVGAGAPGGGLVGGGGPVPVNLTGRRSSRASMLGTGLTLWDVLLIPGGLAEFGIRLGETLAGGIMIGWAVLGMVLVLSGHESAPGQVIRSGLKLAGEAAVVA